jgi:ABC-type transporter Mla maintaining outer membrane lipid asymmetry ATPase subunit MlaF
MVAVARALIGMPKLLILDEPSLGLAPNIVDDILNVASTLVKQKASPFCWLNRTLPRHWPVPTAAMSLKTVTSHWMEHRQNWLPMTMSRKRILESESSLLAPWQFGV